MKLQITYTKNTTNSSAKIENTDFTSLLQIIEENKAVIIQTFSQGINLTIDITEIVGTSKIKSGLINKKWKFDN